jgi:hypothetical protein
VRRLSLKRSLDGCQVSGGEGLGSQPGDETGDDDASDQDTSDQNRKSKGISFTVVHRGRVLLRHRARARSEALQVGAGELLSCSVPREVEVAMKLSTDVNGRGRATRSVIALFVIGSLIFGVTMAFGAVRHFVGGPAEGTNRVRHVSFELSGGKQNPLVSEFRMRGALVQCDDDTKLRFPPRGFAKYGWVRDLDVVNDDGVFILIYDSPHPEPRTYHYRVRGNVNSKGTKAHGVLRVHIKKWVSDGGEPTTVANCDSLPVPWIAHLRR